MQDFAQKLDAVDRVELLTLVDNYVDVLLPADPASRGRGWPERAKVNSLDTP